MTMTTQSKHETRALWIAMTRHGMRMALILKFECIDEPAKNKYHTQMLYYTIHTSGAFFIL